MQFGNPIYIEIIIEKIEKVKKFALRVCLKQLDIYYVSLLLASNLPALSVHRKYITLCTCTRL